MTQHGPVPPHGSAAPAGPSARAAGAERPDGSTRPGGARTPSGLGRPGGSPDAARVPDGAAPVAGVRSDGSRRRLFAAGTVPARRISVGGVPLARRLTAGAHELARRVVARLAEELPVYATLPAEQVQGDVTEVVVRAIRGFAQALRTGRLPTGEELASVHRSAARRAQERIPLDAVVGAYFVGADECLEQVLADARPEDLADVVAAQQLLLRYLDVVTGSVYAGYIAESQAELGERQSARQALLSVLLEGAGTAAARQAAERAGMRLPPAYWVLSLAVGPHPDEHAPGVDARIAAGRKLRRLRAELERHAHGTALTALSADGGLALLPAGSVPPEAFTEPAVPGAPGAPAGTGTAGADTGSPAGAPAPGGPVPGADGAAEWERLGTLVADLARACGAELTAAAVPARPQDVAGAARLAVRVRQVARDCGRAPGLYRLDDVLLEYQLTLPSPARDRLAALLGPLRDRADLLDTLRTFLATGLDRRRTAERLHIHPNTVDYRLRRTTALTGLSATHGPDLPTIQAALAAFGGTAPLPPGR